MEAEFERAYGAALKALSRRDLLESELRRLLAAFPLETVDAVTERLRVRGLLNDSRSCELLVASKNGRRAQGSAKLRETLQTRGAPSEVVEIVLRNANDDSAAKSLLDAKFSPDQIEMARAGRLLYSRGFDEDTIQRALGEFWGALEE
jgi:regulatory protein